MGKIDTIEELKKYIANSTECAEDSKNLMERAVADENFAKAAEMKIAHSLHSMFALRLQRLVDGKPAFEEKKTKIDPIEDYLT